MSDIRKSCKILLADDEENTAKRIKDILISHGYKKVSTRSRIKSFKQLEGFNLVMLDIVWPRQNRPEEHSSDYFGIYGLRYLRRISPNTRVILFSRHLFDLDFLGDIKDADGYFNSQADAFDILNVVSGVLEQTNSSIAQKAHISRGYLILPDVIQQDSNLDELQQLKILKTLLVLELTLRDGRADLFGLEENTYKKLIDEIRQMQSDCQNNPQNTRKWKQRLGAISTIVSSSTNLLNIVKTITDLLP